MISELYLKRAVSIRKEYLQIRLDIEKYESLAKDLISSLSQSKDGFQKLLNDLNSKKVTNPEVAKQKLAELVLNTEQSMNDTESSVNALNKKIDKLREDENNLYKELRNTYTELSEQEIKKEVQDYLTKQNLS